jgi:glycosyltransferase involved in cell wall biosynthesis
VYPDVLVASGLLKRNSALVGALALMQRWLYRSMTRIVVIGRDMEALVARASTSTQRIVRIPNWADLDNVRPTPRSSNPLLTKLGLTDKFVIQYSGNMGRTHGLACLTDAAQRLRNTDEVHFLFIGTGAKKRWLERAVEEQGLTNVTLWPYQPRDELGVSLGACDLAIISFAPGMSGLSVPSRMYNVMAAGKPILAVADPDSELAQMVREEMIGWVTSPGDAGGIMGAILEAKGDVARLAEMGGRARTAAEMKYSYGLVIDVYRSVLGELLARVD